MHKRHRKRSVSHRKGPGRNALTGSPLLRAIPRGTLAKAGLIKPDERLFWPTYATLPAQRPPCRARGVLAGTRYIVTRHEAITATRCIALSCTGNEP